MVKIKHYFIQKENITYIELIKYDNIYSIVIHFVSNEVLPIDLLTMTDVANVYEKLEIDYD